jgi:hypothetical protein
MAYTAVVLDEISRNRVLERVRSDVEIAADWLLKAHHMTIELKDIAKTAVADRDGELLEMVVTHIGRGIGIVAVRVTCDHVPSKNAVKHVTVAHKPEVKAKESNNISDWQEIDVFTISGRIAEVKTPEVAK